MKVKLSIRTCLFAATALSLALAGCASDIDSPLGEELELGMIEQPAYVLSTAIWPSTGSIPNMIWNIPVCWDTANFATEKGWVRTVIESRYENQPFFHLNFTGWGTCVAGAQ